MSSPPLINYKYCKSKYTLMQGEAITGAKKSDQMTRRSSCRLIFSALALAAPVCGQTNGGIQGLVLDQDGKPANRVYVVYTRTAGGGLATSGSYGVKNDGSFEFSGLAAGTYTLCILEEFVAELLEEHGYRVELTKQTPDHGYDIFACTQNALGLLAPLIVQCKRYRIDRTVGVSLVRELHPVQTTMNIPHAMLATTARFSRQAQRFAAERVRWSFMKLADYETLASWLSKVQR